MFGRIPDDFRAIASPAGWSTPRRHPSRSAHRAPRQIRLVVWLRKRASWFASGGDLVLDLVLNQDGVYVEVLGCSLKRLVGKVSGENLRDAFGRR